MLVAGNRVFDTLTVEERAWMQFRSLVSLFIHDGLKRGDPADTMGELFAQWQFGVGLEPVNAPALLAPFFGRANSLLTSQPMWKWKPYMEMAIKYDKEGDRIRNWYTLIELLGQMPWLARLVDEKDPSRGLTDRNVYWLRDLKNKRGGVTDYCDSFRLFCRWLLYTSAVDIAAKFPGLVLSGEPGSVERLDQIAEALKILSLDDWILLKKNKGFRNVADQFKARRQYDKGKTEIFQYMKEFAATREEVLDSGYMQLQDLLAVDKPTGTEGTQGYRLDFYEWSEAQKLNLVFIFGFPGVRRTEGLVGERLADAQRFNRNYAIAHWAKLAAMLRLAGIRSDINDPMSGEEIDEDARFYPDATVWPYTRSGPVSPVWSTIIRTGFKVAWNSRTDRWNYIARRGTATSKTLPQEDQDFLWDWFRTLIRDRADEVQEKIWMKDLDLPSGVFSVEDVDKAVSKGYFAGLRAEQCYVFAMQPELGSKNPVPLESRRLRIMETTLTRARKLRDAWGAANVVWVRGYSPLPNHGLAHWREVAWDFFDLAMLGDTEVMDARAWKMQACKTLLSYHDTRILVCRHEYSETCNGSGNGCEGWLKGQSLIEWFYFQQFKLIAKPIALAWISPHGDKQKWEQLVSLLNYPDKEKDSEKYDIFWLEKIMSGRPIEWIFDRAKGLSALWGKLSGGKIQKVPWDRIDEERRSYEKRWSHLVKGLAGYAQKAFNHRTPGLEWEYEKVVAIMAQGSDLAWKEASRGLEGQFVSTY